MDIHKPALRSCEVPQKKLGPISSAVLTFVGYKRTNRQTSKVYKIEMIDKQMTLTLWNSGRNEKRLIPNLTVIHTLFENQKHS